MFQFDNNIFVANINQNVFCNCKSSRNTNNKLETELSITYFR